MRILISVAIAALAAGPVSAQGNIPVPSISPSTAAIPMPPLTSQCELHIWPAERFQAKTTGWGVGFGLIGALADSAGHANGDKARRANLASALDPEGQMDALKGLDLIQLLGLRKSQIITHPEPLDAKTAGRTMSRHTRSTSPCYAELVVTGLLYQKAAIYGRSLKTSFLFRNFGAATEQPVKFSTTGGNGLKLFPPDEGADVTASNQELVAVFQKNFVEAAANFARKRGS